MTLASTTWWIVGYALGAAVVLVAAALLVAAIALVRRVVGQAGDIVAALEGARSNTAPLVAIAEVNLALERIAAGLERLRGAQAARAGGNGGSESGAGPGFAGRIRGRLGPRESG